MSTPSHLRRSDTVAQSEGDTERKAASGWDHASKINEDEDAASEEVDDDDAGDLWGVSLAFEELTYMARHKYVLRDVCGLIPAGKVTGLIGSESSGAEELMRCLGGYYPLTQGRIHANGVPIESSMYGKCVGYVSKHTVDRLSLSVRQNLLFAYLMKTRQPSAAELKDFQDAFVEAGYEEVEVEEIACPRCDRFTSKLRFCPSCGSLLEGWRLAASVIGLSDVGDILLGEATEEIRKRVSIASELLHLPRVLFLEVPTRTLDLSSALRLMKLLQALAHDRGMTVISTLAQPRRPLFELLDNVILLDNGGIAYAGRHTRVLPYFQELGHDVNEFDCPSDYFLDIAGEQEESRRKAGMMTVEDTALVAAFRHSQYYTQLQNNIVEYYRLAFDNITPGIPTTTAPSTLTRLKYLLYFKFMGMKNDWKQGLINISLVVLLGLVAGLAYSDSYEESKQFGIQNRVGMLFFILCAVMLGSLNAAADFTARRPLLQHEINSGYYSTFEHIAVVVLIDVILVKGAVVVLFGALMTLLMGIDFMNHTDQHSSFAFMCLSMAMTHLPFSMLSLFVGAVSSDTAVAQSVMIGIFVCFVALGGLLINLDTLPVPIQYLKYTSILKYSYESLVIRELRDRNFGCNEDGKTGNPSCYTGNMYITLQGFDQDREWLNIDILGGITIGFFILATGAMWFKNKRRKKIMPV